MVVGDINPSLQMVCVFNPPLTGREVHDESRHVGRKG
ncbi:ectoine synthase [Thermoactinomyces sp. CICC 10735]